MDKLLQEYILIPLDIFKENMHNKIIDNELEAWLSFVVYDEPEKIIELIETYPKFKAMYEEIYNMCCNIERVMRMYSKELAELDRNTVQYMIEEQEKLINEQAEEINEKEMLLNKQAEEIAELRKRLENLSADL